MPIAGICFFHAGTTPPTGALECDGSEVSKTTYADLFAAIGTTWDAFDGASVPAAGNFRLPMSVDSGGLPIYPATLGSAGAVGDKQTGQNKSHTHTGSTTDEGGSHAHNSTEGRACSAQGNWGNPTPQTAWEAGTYSSNVTLNATGNHTHTVTIDNQGADDFRPESHVGLWCIWAIV